MASIGGEKYTPAAESCVFQTWVRRQSAPSLWAIRPAFFPADASGKVTGLIRSCSDGHQALVPFSPWPGSPRPLMCRSGRSPAAMVSRSYRNRSPILFRTLNWAGQPVPWNTVGEEP